MPTEYPLTIGNVRSSTRRPDPERRQGAGHARGCRRQEYHDSADCRGAIEEDGQVPMVQAVAVEVGLEFPLLLNRRKLMLGGHLQQNVRVAWHFL